MLALASLRSLKKQSWKSASWRGLWKKENRSGGLVSESPSSARGMPETKFWETLNFKLLNKCSGLTAQSREVRGGNMSSGKTVDTGDSVSLIKGQSELAGLFIGGGQPCLSRFP